jgi:hypothetical protein
MNQEKKNVQEKMFKKRLDELGLDATYRLETKEMYSIEQVRFWVNVSIIKVSCGPM